MLYNVFMVKCTKCEREKSFFEITSVIVTTKTGEMCYGRRDVHPRDSVTGRVETKQYGFEKTVRVELKLCADCLWTAKQNARRSNGSITIRELR